jgi:tRNA pseudouridine38-40 synthase
VKHVPADFHARFSATARRYRYVIYNHRLRPAVLSQGVTHFHQPLDAERMQRAAQCLLGRMIYLVSRGAVPVAHAVAQRDAH